MESLPTWLLSIHVRKVSPEVGRKLILFQREAKQVLADYLYPARQWLIFSSAR